MRIRKIFITTTFDCNLKCHYCFEHDKTGKNMNVKNMQYILQKEFCTHKDIYDLYLIILHGGEPFLAFKEIKELCEWTWRNYTNNKIIFTTTTNGTLINNEIKSWLFEHRNQFLVILSIDGKRDTHNLNRGNSFDKIDLKFYLSTYNRPWVKMTVTPLTVGNLYENFKFLQDLGFRVNPTLACEIYWNKQVDLPQIESELSKLVEYYICNPTEVPGDLLSLPIERFITRKNNYATRCSLGSNCIAYDIYGNKYPCQNFISNFSQPYNAENIDDCYKLIELNDYRKITKDCVDCPIKEVCSPCYGLNYSNRGDMGKIDKIWCDITKILVYFNAYLLLKALANKKKYVWLKNKNNIEIATLALAVKHLLKN